MVNVKTASHIKWDSMSKMQMQHCMQHWDWQLAAVQQMPEAAVHRDASVTAKACLHLGQVECRPTEMCSGNKMPKFLGLAVVTGTRKGFSKLLNSNLC